MPTSDTNLQQFLVWVGTTAQITSAIQGGDIGSNDFAITTDGPDYATEATITALSVTDSITLADNYCYQGGEQTSLTIAVPSTATVGFVAQITFKSGATPTAITVPQTGFVWDKRGEDVSGGVFTAVANRDYTFIIGYNGFEFVCYSSGV